MARVTSKLQVTVPKAIAEQFAIRPGDEIDWIPAGDGIRVVKRRSEKSNKRAADGGVAVLLAMFDAATRRQRERNRRNGPATPSDGERGWTREDLYDRGRTR
jgi:AbrB family looped-hinge helix DNA binding protein